MEPGIGGGMLLLVCNGICAIGWFSGVFTQKRLALLRNFEILYHYFISGGNVFCGDKLALL